MDLFEEEKQENLRDLPLAVRMRPRTLDEYAGQEHILGKGKLLRRAIEADRINSLILYGPPGVGKTSLAWCIAHVTKSGYIAINATTSNVEELRKVIAQAKHKKASSGKKTILFIDEIHRFNKAQQDVLMPDVEEGNPVLIGATVHNPYFSLVAPLLSRSLVVELKSLKEEDILTILSSALKDKERGFGELKIKIDKKALAFLAKTCEGDARRSLNALEIGVLTAPKTKDGFIDFNLEVASESIQKKPVVYDKDEDAHYDTASAFIKSMRGSDPDAALYWMAKMLYAGEDPRFIARRICIAAAEDVGNADPLAIVLANAALQISEFVGMPEARIALAQAAIYVSCAPKSNASYLAIDKAMADMETGKIQEVPDHLKDATLDGEAMGHGQGYKYAHDYEGHYVKQKYTRKPVKYYEPADIGYEAKIKQRLEKLRGNQKADKAFTLLELIIVIVIIGLLATVGLTQYSKIIEKMRISEAKANIGTMRKLASSYYLQNGTFSTITKTDLGIGTPPSYLPSSCVNTNYFYYTTWDSSGNKDLAAMRCTQGGKSPQWGAASYEIYAVAVESTGTVSSNISCWASDDSCQRNGFY